MQSALFERFRFLGKDEVVKALHDLRSDALELAGAKSARDRQKVIARFEQAKPYLLFYAAAAWTARTLALAENLERADLAVLPKKWAGEQALMLMDEFEGDDEWLWPFDSDPPWQDDESDLAD